MANKATGRNQFGQSRPVGDGIMPLKVPTEGTDAHGRESILTKDESPNRIDEVNDTLYYLGYAEYGSSESDEVWKIRRIRQVGSVWYQEYPNAQQEYRFAWTARAALSYS